MLIINADDWGRSVFETDAALACHNRGRITSVSAMVFMKDSSRAAELALEHGIDVGLHLNLSQHYDGSLPAMPLVEAHAEIVEFMQRTKYAVLFYNPWLRRQFRDVYQSQVDEFWKLYGRMPSHVDGHQHRHLCANVLIDTVIPPGETVRRNFSFWPGEKSIVNRSYRRIVDKWLNKRYRIVDFLFSLRQRLESHKLNRVIELAALHRVELIAHPGLTIEYDYLMSNDHFAAFTGLQMARFADM